MKSMKELPTLFGKCLGLEAYDHESIKIRTPESTPILEETSPDIITYVREHLPLHGILSLDHRDFLYLSLPEGYFHQLLPFINAVGKSPPPYPIGPHITIATHFEGTEPLLGEPIPFLPKACYRVTPLNWPDIETLWFLTVDLPTFKSKTEHHITFAVKKRFSSIYDLLDSDKDSIVIKHRLF